MFNCFADSSTSYFTDASFAPATSYTSNLAVYVGTVIIAVSLILIFIVNNLLKILSPTSIKSKTKRIFDV